MKKYNVGFIGLGNVGSKIAKNILKNKNNLFIHDLDKKKGLKLIKDGAIWSNNLEEISEKDRLSQSKSVQVPLFTVITPLVSV